VLDANVPWIPGPAGPPAGAWIASIDADPVKSRTPTFEFTADLRLTSGALGAIEALTAAVGAALTAADRARIQARRSHLDALAYAQGAERERDAAARSAKTPIDKLWLSHEIAAFVDDDTIVVDESLPHNELQRYLHCARPGSYFANPASSGGWAPGAAFGVKLAVPERPVIATTGDGFYMFGTAGAALWAAQHYQAPFTVVVYQNRAYSTGTVQLAAIYPDSYAARAGFDGGTFAPPVDFAKEAEGWGAHGENVTAPDEIRPALRRAREANERGIPAVVAVWLEDLL
jgi:acetolactate synthase-1/2/3 large subunit